MANTSCTGSAAFSPEAGRLTADVDRGGAPAVGLLGLLAYGGRKAIVEAEDWDAPAFQKCADAAFVCRNFENFAAPFPSITIARSPLFRPPRLTRCSTGRHRQPMRAAVGGFDSLVVQQIARMGNVVVNKRHVHSLA